MKLRVERDALADAVAWTARTLPKNAGPRSGIMLEADADSITLSSSDSDVSGLARVEAAVEAPGSVLVSGRLLADIARALPNAPVTIDIDSKVKLTCRRSTFTLPLLPTEDYPPIPDLPPFIGKVAGNQFAQAVAQTSVAASRNDGGQVVFTGIRLEVAGELLTMAATDRFRLAVRELPWSPEQVDAEASVIVPGRSLAEAARSLGHADFIRLALGDDERLLGLAGGDQQFTTRLLDGEYPKFRSLLPTSFATTVRVDVAELSEAIKRAALVTERNHAVRLHISDGEIRLEAGAGSETESEEFVEAQLNGDPISIAFNPQYLLDGLTALDKSTAEMRCNEPGKPVVFVGAAESSGDPDDSYQYLLMPVRI